MIVPPKDSLRSRLVNSTFLGRETDLAVMVVTVVVVESLFEG